MVTKNKPAKKTPAKKVAAKKQSAPKKQAVKFNFWRLSNDIETVAYKLDSIKNVIELVAEDTIDNPKSGAMWAAAEMLEVYVDKLERISMDVMDAHKEFGSNQDDPWRSWV